MSWTDPPPDLQDLEWFFRLRAGSCEDSLWRVLWASHEAAARAELGSYDESHPEDWDAGVDRVTAALRAGISASKQPHEAMATTRSPSPISDVVGQGVLRQHEVARSCALARHASRREGTEHFRRRWLRGGVRVSDDEVRAWIAEHAGAAAVPWVDSNGAAVTAHVDEHVADDWTTVAKNLAKLYGWEYPLAATFLVTGCAPHDRMLRVRSRYSTSAGGGGPSARITIEVHPSVPVEMVAEAYTRALRPRSDVGGDPFPSIPRSRLLTERVADAVIKAWSVPGGWAAQNQAMSEPYADAGAFRRTVERAERKLTRLGPPLTNAEVRKLLARRGPREG
jgi:hypothetical protein